MKTFIFALVIAVFAITALAADVSGKWSGSFAPEGQDPSNAILILKQTGSTVTGSAGPDEEQQWPLSNGKFEGNRLTGVVTSPEGMVFKLDVVLEGDHIKGDVLMTQDGEATKCKLDVARIKN